MIIHAMLDVVEMLENARLVIAYIRPKVMDLWYFQLLNIPCSLYWSNASTIIYCICTLF